MVAKNSKYDTNLSIGLGLIQESKILLENWTAPMSAIDLHRQVLSSGILSNLSAYRLRNIVVRSFANRYLSNASKPAINLKRLLDSLTASEISQLFFIYTCRSNSILADYVRGVYWACYECAVGIVTKIKAEEFVRRAIDDGKTQSRWAEGQIERMGRYLNGCCSDFGLLGAAAPVGRRILPFRIEAKVAAYLAYELHFSGIGDNALLTR